jgi:hypothetical protein
MMQGTASGKLTPSTGFSRLFGRLLGLIKVSESVTLLTSPSEVAWFC